MLERTASVIGKFAVMRHDKQTQQTKFRVLLDTYEAALNRARDLYVDSMADGHTGSMYYVVKIVDVVGMVDGGLRGGGKPD